ncbi:MAG: ester cyclase, partial [Pseudomonadota bacterium]
MNGTTKRHIKTLLDQLANATPETLDQYLKAAYHPEAEWRGSHPLNEAQGIAAIKDHVWQPLLHSFPDLERRDNIFIGGTYEGRDYVGSIGHYAGTFRQDWLDIPATGGLIYLRYGEIHQVVDNKIIQSTALIDVLNVIRQAGFWPLAPTLGSEEMWSGPITGDGLVLTDSDPAESAASYEVCIAMQQSLGNTIVERDALLNMSQKDYWHPKMMWYGPCGIGTGRGLEGFVDYHQRPFRIAFPERSAGGANHYARMMDGKYVATSGWPSVVSIHAGGDWLGLAPTGREVGMRVMDFYLVDENLVRENWVPIDIIHILLQLDVDVMARVRQQFRKPAKF